jgi:hypothetical protein
MEKTAKKDKATQLFLGLCGEGGSQLSLKEKVKLLVNNSFPIVEEDCKLLGGCLGGFCRSDF